MADIVVRPSFALFDLPLEIRFSIYQFLVTDLTEHAPALTPRNKDIGNIVSKTNIQVTCLGFLCASRQAYTELIDALSSGHLHAVHKLRVDILGNIRKSRGPTLPSEWVFFPTPARFITNVELIFHIEEYSRNGTTGWIGCGGPGILTRGLLDLLTTFLRYGPTFKKVGESSRAVHKLETISINYLAKDPPPVVSFSSGSMAPGATRTSHQVDIQLCSLGMLQGMISRLHNSGLLVGLVKTIILCCQFYGEHHVWQITHSHPHLKRKDLIYFGSLSSLKTSLRTKRIRKTSSQYLSRGFQNPICQGQCTDRQRVWPVMTVRICQISCSHTMCYTKNDYSSLNKLTWSNI